MEAFRRHRPSTVPVSARGVVARRICFAMFFALTAVSLTAGERPYWIFPEQRNVQVRSPSQLPHAPIPAATRPRTVSDQASSVTAWEITLDDAIRTALENARVIRVHRPRGMGGKCSGAAECGGEKESLARGRGHARDSKPRL